MDFEVTTGVEQLEDHGKIGITAFYNESYHYDMYIEKRGENLGLCLEKHVHDMFSVTKRIEVEVAKEYRLLIRSDRKWYRFIYKDENEKEYELGSGLVIGLATEGTRTMTFTGTYLAMFAENGIGYFKNLELKIRDAEEGDA